MINHLEPQMQIANLTAESFSQKFLALPSGMKVILLYCAVSAFSSLCNLGANKFVSDELPLGLIINTTGVLSIIAFSVAGYWIFERNRMGAWVLIAWTVVHSIQGTLMVFFMFSNPAVLDGNAQFQTGEINSEMLSMMSGPIAILMIIMTIAYLIALIWYLFFRQQEYFSNE